MIIAVSLAVKADAVVVLNQKLEGNFWATPSRDSPNGERLKDGAIQRMSVSVPWDRLAWTYLNPKKISSQEFQSSCLESASAIQSTSLEFAT